MSGRVLAAVVAGVVVLGITLVLVFAHRGGHGSCQDEAALRRYEAGSLVHDPEFAGIARSYVAGACD